MSRISQWLKRRFKELDLLEEYFPLVFTRWQAALWGGSVLAVGWGIYFIVVSTAPASWAWINWVAVLFALFFAGYYVWRIDHIRLTPKIRLGSIRKWDAPTNSLDLRRHFRQIEVECATEAPLEDCKGQLLRVLKWSEHNQQWKNTSLDELLDLSWSNNVPSLTLEPGANRWLNIFFTQSCQWNFCPYTDRKPLLLLPYSPSGIFKFDLRVSAKNCQPEYISLKITTGQNWDDFHVEPIDP